MSDKPSGPPLVSVCMPVYNAERYIADAVESILNQTLGDFEFLIEDNSTDATTGILRRYAKRDPRIQLDIRPKRRLVSVLNEQIGRARGEFIARMDADDIALPERFQKQVDYLQAHPECDVVGSRVWEVDADGDPLSESVTLSEHEDIDAFHFRMAGPALVHPSIMMRRDAVLAVGSYRNFAIEDVDLYLRLAERGRIARVPEFLLKYRIHSANLSLSAAARAWSYPVLTEILTDTCRRRNLPVNLPPPGALPAVSLTPATEVNLALGWRSLKSGHLRTARKYARRLLARRPLSIESWRLVYCAIRGY
jgi:glycosyltransferase involved in cell wall biosynthesis